MALNAARLGKPMRIREARFGEGPAEPRVSIVVPLYGRLDYLLYQQGLFSALDHTADASYQVEIALMKLHCPLDQRTQVLQIAEHYKARVVDFGQDSLVIQAHGSSEKLDALTELLRPFALVELVRSGKLLMARGRSVT